MAILLADKQSKMLNLSQMVSNTRLDADLEPKKHMHLQIDNSSNTQTELLPPPSSITQHDAAAALIISDHSNYMAASPNYNTLPSHKSPKFATQDDEGQQEDLE